ncbi:MAG: sulfite exporter TauE/SafE family protein [Clostridia bacterium]|nr:sulfite exporter TauE/SafE family protein [Clostridia bacterium]
MKNNSFQFSTILYGSLAGMVNGFLGSGAGVVFVSVLLSKYQLTQKQSQATALLAVLPLAVVSCVVYFFVGYVDWKITLWTTLGVTIGGVVGAVTLSNLDNKVAKLLFSLLLIAGGLKMMFV